LLADENIHPDVISYLRQNGCDVADVVSLRLGGQADASILAKAFNDNRIVLTHDRDFGRLAILARQPLKGVVFLRPGHMDARFTIDTLEVINQKDLDLTPCVIVVARRRGSHVQLRIRRW
jgi:predicted nuclease of predicted toxin-antitoxin system